MKSRHGSTICFRSSCLCFIHSVLYNEGTKRKSKLLETASKEANTGNKEVVNRIRHIGNKLLNAVEINAQGAVYLVLQMRLRISRRDFLFINTSNPDDRTFLLKTLDKSKNCPTTQKIENQIT